jgi:hypothetical protein
VPEEKIPEPVFVITPLIGAYRLLIVIVPDPESTANVVPGIEIVFGAVVALIVGVPSSLVIAATVIGVFTVIM